MNLKLVIFDMDGLMYDTEQIGLACLIKAAIKYGYVIDREFGLMGIGMNSNDYQKLVKEKFGDEYPYLQISQKSREMRMTYLKEHGMIVKPGLKELIEFLKDHNIKIAIASSSSKETIDEYNHLAGFDGIFDYIIAGNMVEHSKPDPEIFLKVLEHFNISKDEALVLEDSRNGIMASYNAQIPVICVPDLVKHDLEITKLTYATLPSLVEVKELIEKDILLKHKGE